MKNIQRLNVAVVAALAVLSLGSCANMTPQEQNKATGQIVGGVTGAALGSLIGGGAGTHRGDCIGCGDWNGGWRSDRQPAEVAAPLTAANDPSLTLAFDGEVIRGWNALRVAAAQVVTGRRGHGVLQSTLALRSWSHWRRI